MRPVRSIIGPLLLAALLGGCSSQQARQGADRENSHLRWLVKLYVQADRQGRAKSESDLKQYFAQLPTDVQHKTLGLAGVQDIDELFISERDKKPYIVFYGSPPKGIASGIVGFEQDGASGNRYVGYALGIVEEIPNSRFSELVPHSVLLKK